mmetsp:Transcript_35526/g.94095  ORF Transcript_35526/g.94095 Transcript_35526/m.94095 type:complete len:260 (-) Transcript_35526:585-1364(-)
MHQSRCAISSFCCWFSEVTILSISALTSVKASSCTRVASSESAERPVSPAARSSTAATCLRTARSCSREMDFTCRKDAEFTVLSMFSKDLSSFRILMVSSTATISSMRSFTRWSNSPSLAEHFLFRLARNSWSIASCFSVSSSSLKAVACFSIKSAICSSICVTSFLPAAISSSLAAFRRLNCSTVAFSLAWASARSLSKSSFICSRMPKIWPPCGAWLCMPGVCRKEIGVLASLRKDLRAASLLGLILPMVNTLALSR